MPELRSFTEMDPSDALIIVAFPGAGAASPIAAQYLIQNLHMPLVGDLVLEGMDHLVHVQNGRPSSPIRIHGGDVACEVGGPCRRTYVVSTELPLPPEAAPAVAEAILAWAHDARLILGLDAVTRSDDDDTPDVYHIACNDDVAKRLESTQAPPIGQGLMSGVTGALLAQAGREGRVGTLVVEARKDHPDGRAAAALVTALDPLIPQIEIDAGPLLADAMKLEEQILRAVSEAEAAQQPRRPGHTFI
ncbi:MAG: proteasome assembly chaperone family protein [Thermoplasmatota archaeon]